MITCLTRFKTREMGKAPHYPMHFESSNLQIFPSAASIFSRIEATSVTIGRGRTQHGCFVLAAISITTG